MTQITGWQGPFRYPVRQHEHGDLEALDVACGMKMAHAINSAPGDLLYDGHRLHERMCAHCASSGTAHVVASAITARNAEARVASGAQSYKLSVTASRHA